jgi:citrate synthase
MTEAKAILSLPNGKTAEFPIIQSTIGESGVDVSTLLKQTGHFTYDFGFLSTASCKSSITYIDGDEGILLHRGYTIADLCNKESFSALFFALLYGDLPSKEQEDNFNAQLLSLMVLDDEVKNVISTFRRNAHPMAMMMAGISMLSSKYASKYSAYDENSINETAIDCVAKVCTMGAFVFKYTNELDFKHEINKELTFEENLVNIMFSGTEIYKHKEILTKAINKILILHADHEQNASTSSVRLVASTDVNIYASVVAGFAALWGPLHGGANEAVINMLDDISTVDRIPEFIAKAKSPESPFRLMGFGHRVYKNYDPRASVLKSSCDEILSAVGASKQNESLQIAKELERIALSDSYFIDRKLFPNVDFYSGIIYKALGMQSSFFTVMFGMGRVAGWTAQAKESMLDKAKKISRPRQIYTGNINKTIK